MRSVARRGVAAALALFSCATMLAAGARASVLITIERVGANVVASGSGSFDITGLTPVASGPQATFVEGGIAVAILGPTAGGNVDAYDGLVGPTSFGTGVSVFPSSGSGDLFGINATAGRFGLPEGYVSGTSLSATDTFAGQTLSSLGLTPGTYTYTWGTGIHADSLVVNIIPGAVPEPSTLVLGGIGALVGAGVCWRRRRADATA